MFCTKCGTQCPEGSPVCVNPNCQAPLAVANNNVVGAAEVGAFAGKLGSTAKSALAKHIVNLLKITALVLLAYHLIDAFVLLVRALDCKCPEYYGEKMCSCASFFDSMRSFASSVISTATRGLTLFAYAVIIEYLAGKSGK